MLKCEKSTNTFSMISKVFLSVLTSLKTHRTFKNDRFLVKKVITLHKCCSASIGTTFSDKFVLNTKTQNNASWNILNLGLFGYPSVLNKSLKNDWVLRNSKKYWKYKFHGVWARLESRIYLLRQPWTKYCW